MIADVGAGEGYFSKLLGDYIETEYGVPPSQILRSCDLFPASFRYEKMECDRVDANNRFPYGDGTFDYVCSIEVIEHLENQFEYARELHRITKDKGRVFISTPNILNLNSRMKFLYSGFWFLFDPIPLSSFDPTDNHINPSSIYFLAYMLYKAGFKKIYFHTSEVKRTSVILLFLLYPYIFIFWKRYCLKMKKRSPDKFLENREVLESMSKIRTLVTRTLILEAVK
jgi:SAM-dependent methyltransferase